MSQSEISTITSSLTEEKLIPQLLSSAALLASLEGHLQIIWPSHALSPGDIVERTATEFIPTVKLVPFESVGSFREEGRYTIFMTDSDLIKPNDTLSGQVRHWIQPNITLIPSTTLKSATGNKLEYIAKWDGEAEVDSYLQCAPGPGPKHRYTFVLARQSVGKAPSSKDFPSLANKREKTSEATAHLANETATSSSSTAPTSNFGDRLHFDLESFLAKKELKIVGITWMKVGPKDLTGLGENLKLGGEAIKAAVVG